MAKDNLFKKRKELQRLTSDFEEDTRRHRQMQRQAQQLQAHLEHLQDAHGQVDAELQEQVEKLGSSEARVSDAVVEHRRSKGYADDYETLEEKNLMLKACGRPTRMCCTPWGSWRRSSPRCGILCRLFCRVRVWTCLADRQVGSQGDRAGRATVQQVEGRLGVVWEVAWMIEFVFFIAARQLSVV